MRQNQHARRGAAALRTSRIVGSGVYLFISAGFLASYYFTSPDYVADTTRFAGDAVGHAAGNRTQFWEFGHLLWRPWAYLGHSLLGALYARSFGDSDIQSTVRFLIQTNLLCSVCALLVLTAVLRRMARPSLAAAVVLAMSGSVAFLDYSHSGAPYIPGLLFSALALLLILSAAENPPRASRISFVAGLSFAVAFGLWFPYIFCGVGMLAALCLWPAGAGGGSAALAARRRPVCMFLCAASGFAILMFAGGAVAKGIGNAGELLHWVRESDNGWLQSGRLARAVTGLPRGFWSFGDDMIRLKRLLLSDPYNPVTIHGAWAFFLGAKLLSFYAGCFAALWVLWKESRPALFILAAAGLPLLLFAVLLFEPSSPERFLPLFPFASAAFAVALNNADRHRVASACVAVLLAAMAMTNFITFRKSAVAPRLAATVRRISALEGAVQSGALIFVPTFNDDLYRLPALYPLNHELTSARFQVTDTVVLAFVRTANWREDFSRRALDQWNRNREVWISDRLLARRPESRWKWVEGDDRRVSWAALPAFFSTLEFDSAVLSGGDGFHRLARNPRNSSCLTLALSR